LAFSAKDYEDSVYRLVAARSRTNSPAIAAAAATAATGAGAAAATGAGAGAGAEKEEGSPSPFPSSPRLDVWRYDLRSRRTTSSLFDTTLWTENFERNMHAMWELAHLRTPKTQKSFHIISTSGTKKEPTQVSQVYTKENSFFSLEIGVKRRGDKGGFSIDGDSETGTGDSANRKEMKLSLPRKPIKTTVPVSASAGTSVVASGAGAGAGTSTVDINLTKNSTPTPPKAPRRANQKPLPADMFASDKYIFLNIGGFTRKEGWYNVNSQTEEIEIANKKVQMHVDINRLMHDLHGFPDKSVSAIYASHILEHSSHGMENGEPSLLLKTLREWYRVLRPGGLLLISVPDLPTLFQLYLSPKITDINDRWLLTRVIYGAQTDEYDYHKVGFDQSLLSSFISFPFQLGSEENAVDVAVKYRRESLQAPAFCNITRVQSFQLFDDSSEMSMFGHRISLNLAAKKCHEPSDTAVERAFQIETSAIPYVADIFPHTEICTACTKTAAADGSDKRVEDHVQQRQRRDDQQQEEEEEEEKEEEEKEEDEEEEEFIQDIPGKRKVRRGMI